jgi:hypothetical protein
MYQVIQIRINDESGIETGQFLQLLAPELQKANNLIVKRRVLEVLASLSDFDALKSNQ